uniref:Uncharacterized protein n=1 Tax=Anopheles farauti TaxID=69004 RepID=A0A182QQK5_9DIPT
MMSCWGTKRGAGVSVSGKSYGSSFFSLNVPVISTFDSSRTNCGRAYEGSVSFSLQIDLPFRIENGRHAGAALQVRYLHTVDDRVPVPARIADLRFDLARRNVLALPAVRVARAILEEKIAPLVGDEQIAGQEGGVTLAEDIAHNLLLRRTLVDVAEERPGRVVRDDLADEQTRFVRFAQPAETVLATQRLTVARRRIGTDDRNRIHHRDDARHEPNRTDRISVKNCEAENFLRVTTVAPNRRAWPMLIIPPALLRRGLHQRRQILGVGQDRLLDGFVHLIQRHRRRQRVSDFRDRLGQRFAVDQRVTVGHRHAVHERVLAQVVIDQWHDHAQLRQAQPRGNEFGPVFLQQTDHIAMLVAVRVEHVGQAVRVVVYLQRGKEQSAP